MNVIQLDYKKRKVWGKMQRKVTFTESDRDQKIVQGILEYKEKQGLTTFIDAVRNICEIGLDYKRLQEK